jgi:DNA-binding PadR family transcriptional regulator
MNEKTSVFITYIASKQKVSVTSLMKLSYLCDLIAVTRELDQISNFEYIRYNYGPFDSSIYEYLKKLSDNSTLSTTTEYADDKEYAIYETTDEAEVDYTKLSEKEVAIIDEVTEQLKGYGAKALTEVAYKTKPMLALGATLGGNERLIGNTITTTEEFGDIIGYENHSGQTKLGEDAVPLATVLKGAGNNATDGHEGARYKNVIGSYLHGSILPKNPLLADFLIETAVTHRYGAFTPKAIDDGFAEKARGVATQRPR